jgi:hypothetical protein
LNSLIARSAASGDVNGVRRTVDSSAAVK